MKNHFKRVSIHAHDGENSVYTEASLFAPGDSLTKEEFQQQVRSFKRAFARALTEVAFSDFGIDNITIRNKR